MSTRTLVFSAAVQHPSVPWVTFRPIPGGVVIHCGVCNAQASVVPSQADQFSRLHSVHQSSHQSRPGLGDAVARVAKPVARALGKDPNCLPCEQKRHALNQMVPAVPFLRRR